MNATPPHPGPLPPPGGQTTLPSRSVAEQCLLVAVGPNPLAEQLVRWTHRLATMLGARWVAVHVETSQLPDKSDQRSLNENLTLARELGAEVVMTHDQDVAAALQRVALEHNVTQIVVGHSPRGDRLTRLFRRPLVDRLLEMVPAVEIHVAPANFQPPAKARSRFEIAPRSSWREYAQVIAVIAALTGGGMLLPHSYYVQIGLLYLLAINVLSLRVGRGPIFTASVLAALIWDYIFVYPYFDIAIGNLQDVVLLVIYFVLALIAGRLTARIRAQARNERLREERATALFHFTRTLAEAKTLAEAAQAAIRQMDELFGAQTALAFADENRGPFEPRFSAAFPFSEKNAAVTAFRSRRPAGRFSNSLAASEGYYVPLVRGGQAFGVLAVKLPARETLTLGQRDLLDAFARQLALMVEREHLHAASEREKLLTESEKLHRALLESVSHELRTPLAVITATSEELAEADIPPGCTEMVAEIREAGQRLTRLVGNLLDQTRLESGALKPHVDWCDPQDLVNAAVESTRDALADHPLEIVVPEDMTFVRADFVLTEQALVNLLLNSASHTPPGTAVSITAGVEHGGKRVFFTVADNGPGLPATMREQLFNKFARGAAAPAGGLGLGLSIVRGFIAAQGGEVQLGDNPGGGAQITLYLPHTTPDNPPPE